MSLSKSDIYSLSVEATLIDPKALDMLKTFLKKSRKGHKSIAEQAVAVYKQCEKYKNDRVTNLTSVQIEELSDMGLPFHLETALEEANKTGDISSVLQRIKEEQRDEIDLSKEYKNFRNYLLK